MYIKFKSIFTTNRRQSRPDDGVNTSGLKKSTCICYVNNFQRQTFSRTFRATLRCLQNRTSREGSAVLYNIKRPKNALGTSYSDRNNFYDWGRIVCNLDKALVLLRQSVDGVCRRLLCCTENVDHCILFAY